MLYLHIGTHKTATTFMQRHVFPKFEGVEYLRWTNIDRFLRLEEGRKYLASNERLAGRLWSSPMQIEQSLKRLSEMFPDAQLLMSFRRHDGFIVSSYKELIHQGGILRFDEYFDIDNDSGFMKREQFFYRFRIELVKKYFGRMPFVFLFDEIRNNFKNLLHDIGAFMHVRPLDVKDIKMKVSNKGGSFYAIKILRWINQFDKSEFNPSGKFRLSNKYTITLRIDPSRIGQYWLSFLPDRDFLTPATKEKILSYYQEDWEYVRSQAALRTSLFPTSNASKAD